MTTELRLDWFEATLECATETLLAMCIIVAPPDDPPLITYGKGRNGYNRGIKIEHDSFEVQVLDLGNGGYPHLIATGQSADLGKRIAASLNVPGRVSRIDVACDSTEGWLAAEKRVLTWADEHPKTKVLMVGDFYRQLDGRTYYIGAASSDRRVRVYEKGIQLSMDPNWIRVEYQLRPKGRAAKAWAFSAPLDEIANSSRAFVALRAHAGLYSPPLFERPARQPIIALAHQYGRILKEHVPEAWRAINDYLTYEYVSPEWLKGQSDV